MCGTLQISNELFRKTDSTLSGGAASDFRGGTASAFEAILSTGNKKKK
jgi:hypothetical protein